MKSSTASADDVDGKENGEEKPGNPPPPIPIRVSSRQPVPGILSMEQLQNEYADIARYKIFQLAGTNIFFRIFCVVLIFLYFNVCTG